MNTRHFLTIACSRFFAKTCPTALLLGASLVTVAAYADQTCNQVDAYWETNFMKLVENLSECNFQSWQKCSQAAAIHYDLNAGSLFHRAKDCGLSKPETPGSNYLLHQPTDTQQCTMARDELRKIFENRAQARLACAAARSGGENQEWLDSQCTMHRSKMASYHLPFRDMTQSCKIDYHETVAWRN